MEFFKRGSWAWNWYSWVLYSSLFFWKSKSQSQFLGVGFFGKKGLIQFQEYFSMFWLWNSECTWHPKICINLKGYSLTPIISAEQWRHRSRSSPARTLPPRLSSKFSTQKAAGEIKKSIDVGHIYQADCSHHEIFKNEISGLWKIVPGMSNRGHQHLQFARYRKESYARVSVTELAA